MKTELNALLIGWSENELTKTTELELVNQYGEKFSVRTDREFAQILKGKISSPAIIKITLEYDPMNQLQPK